MSLLFNGLTAGTGNYVDAGSGAALDSLDSVTVIWWDYPNTVAAGNGRIFVKLEPGTNGLQIWSANINAGSGRMFHIRTGGGAPVSSDIRMNTNTRQASAWNFNAISDSAAGGGKAYWGDLTTGVADVTLSATGNGAEADHSAEPAGIGGAADQTSLDGRIAMIWIYNRVLTIGEIRLHQWMPSTILSGCVLKHNYLSTLTLQDLSGNGNAGTLTNTPTLAVHVPLGPPFARSFGWEGAFTAAAPGGAVVRDMVRSGFIPYARS